MSAVRIGSRRDGGKRSVGGRGTGTAGNEIDRQGYSGEISSACSFFFVLCCSFDCGVRGVGWSVKSCCCWRRKRKLGKEEAARDIHDCWGRGARRHRADTFPAPAWKSKSRGFWSRGRRRRRWHSRLATQKASWRRIDLPSRRYHFFFRRWFDASWGRALCFSLFQRSRSFTVGRRRHYPIGEGLYRYWSLRLLGR